MRCASHDEEGRNDEGGQDTGKGGHIEAPPAIRAQRPIEPLLLDEPQSADGQLEVSWSSPYRCHNGEDDPAWNMTGVVQTIIEGDRHSRGIDEDGKGEEPQPPTTPAMVPRKGQLRQELWMFVIILLEGSSSSLVLVSGGGAGIVVDFSGGTLRVRKTAPGVEVLTVRGVSLIEGMPAWRTRAVIVFVGSSSARIEVIGRAGFEGY